MWRNISEPKTPKVINSAMPIQNSYKHLTSPTPEKDMVKSRYKREGTFYNKHIEPANLHSKYSIHTVNNKGSKEHRGFQSSGTSTTSNNSKTVFTKIGSRNINTQSNIKKFASENT